MSFWSAEPGFGLYEQQRTATTCDATLKLLHGSGFELEAIDLPVVGAAVELDVSLDGVKRAADALVENGKTRVQLDEAARLAAGSELQIHLAAVRV